MLDLDGVALETADAVASRTPADRWAKRSLDVVIAAGLLLALAPVLLLLAALIRVDSKGPALFRQARGGQRGTPFTILKFRTMTVAEDGDAVVQAVRHDPRCTRLGRLLRRTSIDELPQLWNVLYGDMSLVGPRPHAVAHDRQFQELVPSYALRFEVKPGITGLAQVRGVRGETRTVDDVRRRTACDLEYVRNWSLGQDLKILAATLKTPLDPRAH